MNGGKFPRRRPNNKGEYKRSVCCIYKPKEFYYKDRRNVFSGIQSVCKSCHWGQQVLNRQRKLKGVHKCIGCDILIVDEGKCGRCMVPRSSWTLKQEYGALI